MRDGEQKTACVTIGVILAAGALQSSQLQELSKIGSKDILQNYGIDVIINTPLIGEHLQDQAVTTLSFEAADHIETGVILSNPSIFEAAWKNIEILKPIS